MACSEHNHRDPEHAKYDRVFRYLGYAAYVLLILCCLVANIVAGFKSPYFLLIFFAAATLPWIGDRITRLVIGKVIEIGGSVSHMKKDVEEIKGATYQIVSSINARTGDVHIVNVPSTTAAYQASTMAIVETIQIRCADLPESERNRVQLPAAEVRRKLARGESGLDDEINRLVDEIRKLPENLRTERGLDGTVAALLSIVGRPRL